MSHADREGGFVAIHHQFWSSPNLTGLRAPHLFVFVTLIHLANWKPGHFWVGRHRIDIARGELAHSLTTIARRARASVREVRTTIDNLICRETLSARNVKFDTTSDTTVRVLRVVNYEKFQTLSEEATRPPPKLRHATDTPPTPIEPEEPEEPVEACAADAAPRPPRVQDAAPPPARPARRRRDEPDPRHQPLVLGLVADFQAARHVAYGFAGAKDAAAVKTLLALGTAAVGPDGAADEVRRRWRIGLGLGARWPGCASIALLPARWNELATAPPKLGPDGRPLKRVPKVHVPTEYS